MRRSELQTVQPLLGPWSVHSNKLTSLNVHDIPSFAANNFFASIPSRALVNLALLDHGTGGLATSPPSLYECSQEPHDTAQPV